ncbi:MAG TPA: glycoside hydrolase [Thermoanaerobaculia bacterium]|nr:glycoside hydrolase [Thermoanaerobaculia bacterium]
MHLPRRLLASIGFCLSLAGTLSPCSSAAGQLPNVGDFTEMRWRMIGPFRGGRTVAVSGVSGQPNVFYMAPNNGGVWKSTDYGRVWTPIFDDQPTGSIGALAVAPSDPNVLYVGSGEGLQRPDLSVGDGVYKSTDAGKTWRRLGLADGRQIAAILVDPKDSKRLFVAVLGHPYGPNNERGVFRSMDGGETWHRVLYKDDDTGAVDLAFDPGDPQKIYAVLWSARQGPWEYGNEYEGPGSGLFVSADGGTTWRQLTKGLPASAEGLGRIGIAVAPSDPKRMYAVVSARERAGGLFRSDDAGENWRRVNSENRVTGRGGDFAEVRVDPKNPDIVYCANTSTYRSTDGGTTFTAIKGAPGGDDYHRIWINPENPQVMILGADQGATITVNGGETWSSWYNQPTAQFFHVSTDNRFPYRVYGGQQESGSAAVWSRGNDGAITFREFHPVGVEEYGYVAPDPLHPGVIYGGKLTRYDETTGQIQNVGPVPLRGAKDRFDRTAPVIFSPADPHVLFFASQVLWKTSNGGETWEAVSPDLTRQDPGTPPSLGHLADKDTTKHRGVIYSIAPSPRDSATIWVGTDDGLIHVTRDGGKTWHNVTPPEMTPWSKVTQMDASRFDTETAYASVSRFRLDDLKPYVYRTHDGGKTWQKIVTGLPENAPANTVREDPERKGLLFAGTESQVWVSLDDGDHWQSLRLNMPATSIRDLVIHEDDVVVGTHGRSFWILDDITPLRQLDSRIAEEQAHLFRPQLARRVRWNMNNDTPLPPEEPAGKNPPDGAILNYQLRAAAAGPVTLEILDRSGRLVRRFSSADKPEPLDEKELNVPTYWVRPPRTLSADAGFHRFVWDLHYPPPAALSRGRDYPMTAILQDTPRHPLGPWVLPGQYTVKLTAGATTSTQPLTVAMDPRVKTSAEDLSRQFELATRISEAMHEDFKAIQEVRSLRAQLRSLKDKAAGGPAAGAIAALETKATALEGSTGGFGFGTRAGADNLSRINGSQETLLEVVENADAKPTAAMTAAAGDVQKALAGLLARWNDVKTRYVSSLNEDLRKAKLPPVDLTPK